MAKPLMLTDDIHYQATYFIKNHSIKHEARCQTEICIKARETYRVATRNRYGKFRFCADCETTFPANPDNYRCPCCSQMLRKRSKYAKTKEQQVVRY